MNNNINYWVKNSVWHDPKFKTVGALPTIFYTFKIVMTDEF